MTFFKKNMLGILLAIYMHLIYYELVTPSIETIYSSILIFILSIVIWVVYLKRDNYKRELMQLFALLALFIFVYFLRLLKDQSFQVTDLYIFGAFFLYSTISSNYSKINEKVLYVNFILLSSYLGYHFFKYQSFENVFTYFSKNLVSLVLFYNLFLLNYVSYRNRNKIYILPLIITVVLSVLSDGRSAILTSILYFLFLLIYYHEKKNVILRIIMVAILVSVLLYFVRTSNGFLEVIMPRMMNYGISYEDNIRSELLMSYINNLDVYGFMIGVPFSNTNLISYYGHAHNSFLTLHSSIGILILVFIWKFYRQIANFLLNKNYFYLVTLVVFSLRIFTDNALFFSGNDFVFYLYFFAESKKNTL